MTDAPLTTKMKHLALTYLSKWEEDHDLFIHIELLQKILGEIRNKGNELSEAYKEAEASLGRLMNKDSLTEDEMNEYSSMTGWVETAIEELQPQREVLAESILIALSKMIETRANAGADLIVRYSTKYAMTEPKGCLDKLNQLIFRRPKFHRFLVKIKICSKIQTREDLERIKQNLTWDLCRLGPKIRNAHWADAVRVGGNYVRHRDEWKVFPYEQVIITGKTFLKRKKGSLESMLPSGQARANAQVIVSLGIPAKDFLEYHREVGFKMVDLLGLDTTTNLAPHFSKWMDAMTKYVKSEIGV